MEIISLIFFKTMLYLLVALSFSVIYYPNKFFNFAHASIIALGAYLSYALKAKLGLGLSIPLAIIICVCVGVTANFFIYRPMRKRNAPLWTFLIASIGLYTVIQNSISLFFGDDTKILLEQEIEGYNFFGANLTAVQIFIIAISVLLFAVTLFIWHKTKVGREIQAVSQNKNLSMIYGIKSEKIITYSFIIGSFLAGVVGVLSACDTNMTPTIGFNLLLYGVVAMIIGGVGSIRNLLFGALILAASQELAAYFFNIKWFDAITYIILIAFLVFRPLGFSGNRLRKIEI